MIEPYSEIAIHSEKKGYYMNHTLTKYSPKNACPEVRASVKMLDL